MFPLMESFSLFLFQITAIDDAAIAGHEAVVAALVTCLLVECFVVAAA